jgi:hypothetical protein
MPRICHGGEGGILGGRFGRLSDLAVIYPLSPSSAYPGRFSLGEANSNRKSSRLGEVSPEAPKNAL